jgi:hypothetical protein
MRNLLFLIPLRNNERDRRHSVSDGVKNMPIRRQRPVTRCEVLFGVGNANFWAPWACRNLVGGLAGLLIVWAASCLSALEAGCPAISPKSGQRCAPQQMTRLK